MPPPPQTDPPCSLHPCWRTESLSSRNSCDNYPPVISSFLQSLFLLLHLFSRFLLLSFFEGFQFYLGWRGGGGTLGFPLPHSQVLLGSAGWTEKQFLLRSAVFCPDVSETKISNVPLSDFSHNTCWEKRVGSENRTKWVWADFKA